MSDIEAPVDLPHHYQKTEYTCGPAALKMMLDGILGESSREAELAAQLDSGGFHGTRQRVILHYVRSLGLEASERHSDTTVNEIRLLMATGHVVMVCYYLPNEGIDHYAVVVRIGQRHITLQDPWYGPGKELDLDEFDAHWYSDARVATRRDRWLLAVKLPGGDDGS